MREIEFRGIRKDNNELIYGYYVKYEHMGVVKHFIITSFSQVYANSFEVIPETVGQFTGLHDKNGVEIYEHDTVRIENQNGEFDNFIIYAYGNTLCLDCGSHCGLDCDIYTLDFLSYGDDYKSIEVIDNIHERSE